jgi:hypothetical protein
MTTALIILSIITSLGIYGLLSTGFQGNIAKLEISEKQVKNVEVKKKRFEEIKLELTKEKTTLDGDITKLRDGLSTNTTTQTVDQRTGQLVTKANNANRKSFEGQLKEAQTRRDTISKKIDGYNDSITKLDVQILDMQSQDINSSELGAIKYVSELLDWDIKKTANLFILILIFVFDPLAITLVIATNQAFKGKRKDEVTIHDTIHDTIQVDPIIIEKIVEVPVEVIREVEKIVEVPVYIEKQEPIIKREVLKIPEEQTWTETNEEKNQELNDNIKRLIYKK